MFSCRTRRNCMIGRGELGDGSGNQHCFRAGITRTASSKRKQRVELLEALQNPPLQASCPVPSPLHTVELV